MPDPRAAQVETVVIDGRFAGLPGIAHGGFTAGLLAELSTERALEARFSLPSPLDTTLQVQRRERRLSLRDGENAVVEVRPTNIEAEPPFIPSLAAATAASKTNATEVERPSPTCLVCGPERAEGDGLRIFVGPLGDDVPRGVVAGVWSPHPDLATADGQIRSRYIWAALDCPGYWSLKMSYPSADSLVTARLAVDEREPVPVGEPLLVIAWPIAQRGSRLQVADTALVTTSGKTLAVARATWITNPATART